MKRKVAEVNLAEPNEKSSGGDPAQRLPGQPLLWPKGVVHMADFMPLEEQRGLLAAALRLGCATFGGFEVSHNERTKRMLMMHVGRRTQGPGRHPHAHVPLEWHTIAARVMAAARAQDASLPALDPIDVCVVNLYIAESRLSPHVDVLTIGDPAAPLVSLSLGLACDFCFQKNWGKKHKMHKVVLSSGDALVFGGKARDMVHSVPKIHPNTADGSCSSGDTRVSGLTELLAPAEKQKLASLIGQISPSRSQDTLSFRMNFNFRRK